MMMIFPKEKRKYNFENCKNYTQNNINMSCTVFINTSSDKAIANTMRIYSNIRMKSELLFRRM